METIVRPPDNGSPELLHALVLVNHDLAGLLGNLNTHEQNQFWTNLHQFALAELEGEGNPSLIASERVDDSVRQALEILDPRVATHLHALNNMDRRNLWQVLHDGAELQIEATKHPKARHGGGGQ